MSATTGSRVRRAGGTFVATIPKRFAKEHGLRPGQEITIAIRQSDDGWRELRRLVTGLGGWDRRSERSRKGF